MEKKKGHFFRNFLIILLIIMAAGFFSMTYVKNKMTTLSPYEANPGGSKKILISRENTQWKSDLARDIIQGLGTDYTVRVEGLSSLDKTDLKKWDRVILMSSVMMGSGQKKAEAFIKKAENKDKILHVVTVTAARASDNSVDTITSASYPVEGGMEQGDTGAIARDIILRLKK